MDKNNSEEYDIGDLGESLFETLCTRNNITSTKPQKDKNGWDFITEYDNVQFKHQIKSFSCDYEDYKGRNIKLSNIEKMIKSREPWFITFVDVKNEIYHFVFFDFNLKKRGIKLINKAKKNNEELNKKYMNINPRTTMSFTFSSGNLKTCFNKIIEKICLNINTFYMINNEHFTDLSLDNEPLYNLSNPPYGIDYIKIFNENISNVFENAETAFITKEDISSNNYIIDFNKIFSSRTGDCA